jgi:hypothetical protein
MYRWLFVYSSLLPVMPIDRTAKCVAGSLPDPNASPIVDNYHEWISTRTSLQPINAFGHSSRVIMPIPSEMHSADQNK